MCGYDILILISLTQLRSCMPLVNTVVANTFHRSYFLSTQEFLPSILFSSCCPQHATEIRTSSTFRTMWQHIIELTKCQRAGIVKMPPTRFHTRYAMFFKSLHLRIENRAVFILTRLKNQIWSAFTLILLIIYDIIPIYYYIYPETLIIPKVTLI